MPVQLAAARSAKGQLARYLTVAATHYEVPSIGGTESVRLPRFALILTPTRIPQPQPKESKPHSPHPDLNPSPSPSPEPYPGEAAIRRREARHSHLSGCAGRLYGREL